MSFQQAAHHREMAERTRQRWNYLLTDSLMRTRVLNEQPTVLLVETVKNLKPGTADFTRQQLRLVKMGLQKPQ